MRYVVTWREQPTESVAEYEARRQRVLHAVAELPRSLTFHLLVARVGLGGYAVVETDEPADLQCLRTAYAPGCFTVEQEVDGLDAVAARARGSG